MAIIRPEVKSALQHTMLFQILEHSWQRAQRVIELATTKFGVLLNGKERGGFQGNPALSTTISDTFNSGVIYILMGSTLGQYLRYRKFTFPGKLA